MAVQALPTSNFRIDLDHIEHVTRGISALAIDPIKNIFYYVFPFLGAFTSNYIEMRENDPAQAAMMPESSKKLILSEIKELTRCAGITRQVIPYCALNHHFSTCGGSLSLTKPALFMPHQHLFRVDKSPFGQERPEEHLSEDLWNYSDHQTRFLISRELGHIKENDGLIRIAIKIAVIAALFAIFAGPIGWIAGTTLIVSAIGMYIITERSFEGKMDLVGAEILGKRINNQPMAVQIAIESLEKMSRQNIFRRSQSALARLYITKSGNNVLDFNHQFLTTRISRLKEHLKQITPTIHSAAHPSSLPETSTLTLAPVA